MAHIGSRFSRRTLAQLLGASAASVALPRIALGEKHVGAATEVSGSNGAQFPTGFLWGSATASYQVEGAVHEGGRGPSVWDTFSHTQGKTFHGDTGDVADDFFHLYKADIALMKELGLKSFRFSVAWSRIFPTGSGAPNSAGVDFYRKMVEALLEAGIQPYCTLYHWDTPQPLQDAGGWENKDITKAFADYAGYTAGKLSDLVGHFMTMNEMRTFTDLGYGNGMHAPGLQVGQKRLAQLSHYVVLSHGLAVQAIRASTKHGTKVGLADNITATVPVIESPKEIAAARKAMREENARFLNVIQEGRYTDLYLKRLGSDAPKFSAEELKTIASPLDFVGLNIYQPTQVRATETEAGYAVVQQPASYPHMYSPWLTVGPEALYWGPKLVHELYGVKEIYITENGASSKDEIATDGHIYDTDRVMYLRNYLTQLHRAITSGVPVKGYFLWSLLDNFEWADGYEKRFGIVYVDFATEKRTPKLSADFYKQTIADNRIA